MTRRSMTRRLLAVGAVLAGCLPVTHAQDARGHRHGGDSAYGYGQCRKCDCSRFRGTGNTCKCDHSFYDHQT